MQKTRHGSCFYLAALASAVVLPALGVGPIVSSKAWASPAISTDPGPTGRRILSHGLFANYYPGPKGKRSPAILLIGGSEDGLGRFMSNYALALQRAGYGVLHLSYWRGPGQPERLENIPIEYFEKGLAWLRTQPEVDPQRLAMAGWSRGSEAAVLMGPRHNGLKAVILGMPGSHVFADFAPEPPETKGTSGWSIGGKALPAVQTKDLPDTMDVAEAAQAVLAKTQETPSAALPIAQVDAPVLMICGEMDIVWPSCPMARTMKADAEARGKTDIVVIAYKVAGHLAFGAPAEPGSAMYQDLAKGGGESVAANQRALEDGFAKTLLFLKGNL